MSSSECIARRDRRSRAVLGSEVIIVTVLWRPKERIALEEGATALPSTFS